ncbi:MAG: VWA domain-containing protein [Acidobacteria bacterium]|nr:VWA domain-containing protein [Acidobacteriota bacterium]
MREKLNEERRTQNEELRKETARGALSQFFILRSAFFILLLIAALRPLSAADTPTPLTRREQKDLIAKLPDAYRQFLRDVEPIINPAERDTFLRLETDAQRDAYIDDFWRRRDIAGGTTNHAARDNYYERLEYVKENFEQVSSDRGRIYLLHGPPAAMIGVNCPKHFQPIQIWKYEYIEGFGHDVRLLFYIPRDHREYKLWSALGGTMAMDDLRSNDIVAGGAGSIGGGGGNVMIDCQNPEELTNALYQMQLNKERIFQVFDPPKVNDEDVNRMLRSVVLADPNAPKLAADLTVSYPSMESEKTDAQLTIMVPRAQLKTTAVSGVSVYTIDVVGEVLRDGKMWEKYRYRFDFPGDIKDEKLPIVIDRFLRPATYTARVKLTDPASNAQAILENELKVPALVGPLKPSEESATIAALNTELQSTRAKLRIVPLADGVTSGFQTIQTIVSGTGISGVEFWLDGKKIATRRSPPYTLDLDFGTVPRSRRVRAVAIDSHEQPITGDEIVVNTGTDPFRVRIASPRIAPKLSGPTRVELEVKVPEGKQLDGVELYWNQTRVATMFDPPYVQTVNIPASDGVGYLRAVAKLKDPEVDPVEDVVMVNTPDYMETVDVHLVELPTTVLVGGKPKNDLGENAFKVFDEGQPVKLAKFEHVTNLPLSIGMAVDTSGSMEPRMAAARDAGAQFFQHVLKKGDKAFLVSFDAQPHLVQKWSNEIKDIYSGLARMRPEESTALYDAIVYSLYNFVGVKGQKALVLVTDGKDTASKFTFEQAREYAQRAAVPIYAIGIGIRGSELDVRQKLNHICGDTGGASYYIDEANDLAKIYAEIESELRSQYVLGFYPAADVKAGGKWHEVSVQVAEGKVKTIRGYYP